MRTDPSDLGFVFVLDVGADLAAAEDMLWISPEIIAVFKVTVEVGVAVLVVMELGMGSEAQIFAGSSRFLRLNRQTVSAESSSPFHATR